MESLEDNLSIVKSFSQEMYRTMVQLWGEGDFNSYIKKHLTEMEGKENVILASALLKLENEHRLWFPDLK